MNCPAKLLFACGLLAAVFAACALPRAPRSTQASPRADVAALKLPSSPRATALAVDLMLELGRPLSALEVLRQNPRTSSEPYLATAKQLAQLQRKSEAVEMFTEAFRRDPDSDEVFESFLHCDLQACLRVLDQLELVAREHWEEFEGEVSWRAHALWLQGQAEEAAALLPPLESYYRQGSGCIPTSLGGQSWELDLWREVDPRGLQAICLRVLDTSATSQERALVQLAAICEQLGEMAFFEEQLMAFDERHGLGAETVVQLAAYRSWATVAEYLHDHPTAEDAALALSRHWLAGGRSDEAVATWSNYLEACWAAGEDPGDLEQHIARAPSSFLPAIEERIAKLESGEASCEDPAWEIGELGALYWRLGRTERAGQLWQLSRQLDPDQAGIWAEEQLWRELGVLE